MPALPRAFQKILGSALVPSGNIAVVGSLAAGSPAYSGTVDGIQSQAGAIENGFAAIVLGNRSPTLEDLNGLFFVITQQLAYVLESGIPEWSDATTYYTNQFCRVGNVIYVSLTDANLNNDPTGSPGNWANYAATIAPAAGQARAWVTFNGIDGTMLEQFNVASVVRNSAGNYTINLAITMPNNNYGVQGTCGPADGGSQSSPAGNSGYVCRGTPTSTTQCSVIIPNAARTATEDANVITVTIFGTP